MTSKYKFSVLSILLIMTMLCSILILPVSASEEVKTTALAKIAPALLEKMETASPDEKIPVAIWCSDIDQDNVDKLTINKVGYTQDDIALTYEMPSTELIADLEKGEEGAVDEMQAYLKRTEAKREKERQRTNEYIMTRRQISKEKYNEKSAKIIKEIKLNDLDITFKSQYAPMLIANCTVKEIENIVKNENIESISVYIESDSQEECTDPLVASTKATLGYDAVISKFGLTGDGVVIGMFEAGGNITSNSSLYNRTDLFATVGEVYPSTHVENGACILVNPDRGLCPEAFIYSTGKEKYSNIELLLDEERNVSIINASCKMEADNEVYSTNDKWVDHIVSHHGVSVVASAGNYDTEGYRILSPAMANNVIAVAGYNQNANTSDISDKSDDIMYTHTYYNGNGIEKPDVVMPANIEGGGSSSAAPVLTACIALLYELKPSLAAYPQVVKAIVLASCHRKVLPAVDVETPETMYQGITEKQGAGAPDFYTMVSIVCNGTYGVGRIVGTRTQAVRRFIMPAYGASNMNVSLSWLREGTFVDENGNTLPNPNHSTAELQEGVSVNLNLSVYRNGTQAGISNHLNSSTEMAYFQIDNTAKDYEIRISKATTSYTGTVRYGYAYSTDKPYIKPVTEEGIYYIRNYYSDKYLTLNTSTNETFMSDFTGANNQQWVLMGSENDYEIYPAHYSASKKINFGSQVGSNPYYKSVLGTSDLNLSLKSWETDTTLEPDAYVFTSTSGGSNNIMSYTSSAGIFVRSATESVINMYRMWVLEDINYQNGDVNMDGAINTPDATLIEKGIANTITLSNSQRLLADANYDGKVSIQDATYIRKIVANS